MDYTTYQERVLARASHRWHNDTVDSGDLKDILEHMIEWGNRLDRVKKALMYGRRFSWDANSCDLPVDELIPLYDDKTQRIIHAILGHATESIEMLEAMYGHMYSYKPFDDVNLQEEFGDGEWYRALFLHAVGQTHEQNLAQNDAKLEARFGSTFTEEAANNRDLEAERQVLER